MSAWLVWATTRMSVCTPLTQTGNSRRPMINLPHLGMGKSRGTNGSRASKIRLARPGCFPFTATMSDIVWIPRAVVRGDARPGYPAGHELGAL